MLVCVPDPVCQTDSGNWDGWLAVQDLVGGRHDGIGLARIERVERAVHHRGAALDHRERPDQLVGHPLGRDVEVVQRALGLRAPQPVGGDGDVAEGVSFDALVGHGGPHVLS
jgi:hypothetical protein